MVTDIFKVLEKDERFKNFSMDAQAEISVKVVDFINHLIGQYTEK